MNVEHYLDDFRDNAGKLRDRFKSEYAAGAEVTEVLRQGSEISRRMATMPPDLRVRASGIAWRRASASSPRRTAFPLPAGQQARRLSDHELKTAAEAVASHADRYKEEIDESLKKDATVDKAAREASVDAAEGLKKAAEKLASRVGDEEPASGEALALQQHVAAIRNAPKRPLSPPAQTAWSAVETDLAKIVQAFNLR